MTKRLLSIIIPVYNGEKYIKECLESINKKNNDNIEVLVIDDGSTDNTQNICKKYNNIKYYRNKNHGVSYSRNYGIKHANGKYLMFVDSDDMLIDGWYNKIRPILLKSKSEIIYLSQFALNKKIGKIEVIESIIGYCKTNIPFNMSSACSKIYNTDYIKSNNIKFPEKIINGEDLLFNIRALINTDKFSFNSISVYKYRLNYFSVTHNYNPYFFQSNTLFIECLNSELRNANLPDEKIKEYIDYCLLHSIELFMYKISLLDDKKLRFKSCEILKEKMYSDYIQSYNSIDNNGFFLNRMMKLLNKKRYKTVIFMMRLKNSINKLRKMKSKQWELI